jgi:hypothetical protein
MVFTLPAEATPESHTDPRVAETNRNRRNALERDIRTNPPKSILAAPRREAEDSTPGGAGLRQR